MLKTIKTINNSSGMSLLEVLVALTILVVGLLGATQTILMVIHNNMLLSGYTTALTIAQDQTERIADLPFTDLDSIAATTNNLTVDATGAIVVDATSGKFTRTVTVTPTGVPPAVTEKTVTTTVTWTHPTLTTPTVTSITVVSFD